MIYVNKNDLFFPFHKNGKVEASHYHGPSYRYDLVQGCNFRQSPRDIFFTNPSVNLDGWTKLDSIVIKDWNCRSTWGWLGVTSWGGRVGFVIGEETASLYQFYVLYDISQYSEKGEVMIIDKNMIERLPLGFQLEVNDKIRIRDDIYSE